MISTESLPPPTRLPTSNKLLQDTLAQALRARRRRVQTAGHPGNTLAALAVCDDRVDQALRSASILASEARGLLEATLATASGNAFEDAAFLRVALAIQCREPDWLQAVERLYAKAPLAVRDALWFFPASADAFPLASGHVAQLFRHAQRRTELLGLALELVARCGVRALTTEIEALTRTAEFGVQAHWVLACLGESGEPTRRFVSEGLSSADRQYQAAAMAMVRVAPQLADSELLMPYLQRDESFWAWPVMVARRPREACDLLAGQQSLPEADRLRVLAVGGFLDGVIEACRGFAEQDGALAPEQADVLMLTLGEVPMEARVVPNDIDAKARALREVLLRACRRLHIGLTNDADRCPWDVEQIFRDPIKARSIRLREGKLHSATTPRLSICLIQLTHPIRQWLYLERAVAGGHALALDALDVSRRQMLALTVSDFLHDLHAG